MSAAPGVTATAPAAAPIGRIRVAGASFLTAAGLLLLLLVPPTDDRREVVMLSLTATAFGLVGLLVIGHRTGVQVALRTGKLGAWASLSFAIVFGLASGTWFASPVGSAALIERANVVRALVLVSIGQACWLIGYLVGPGRLLSGMFARFMAMLVPQDGSPGRPTAWGVGTLFALGLLGQAIRIVSGGFGYLQNAALAVSQASSFGFALSVLAHLGDFSLVGVAILHFRAPSARSRTALLAIAGTQLLFGLLSGNKESFVLVLVGLVLGYAAVRRRLPTRLLLVGGLVFLVFVIPFVSAYRAVVRGQSVTLGAQEAFAAAPDIAAASASESSLLASGQYLSLRLREIDNVAIIVQKTPNSVPYRPLSEFALAPVIGVIPRAIWPSKPIIATGYQFSQQYYNLPSTMYTSTAVTPQGDLLRHGGLPVLFLGMLFLGMGYRLIDRHFRPDIDYRHLFFVVALFPSLVKYEVDIVALLASLPATLLAAAVASRIAGRERT